jgi:hypothetical protein
MVAEDAGVAQARKLLDELYRHVADVSRKLEAADLRNQRARMRGTTRKDPIASVLRRDLYETHRLIDGLHRRYPATDPARRTSASRHGHQEHEGVRRAV